MKKIIILAAALLAATAAFAQTQPVPFGKNWGSTFFKGMYASLDEPQTNKNWEDVDAPSGKYSYSAENLTYSTTSAGQNQFKSKGYELKTGKTSQFEFVSGSTGKAVIKAMIRSTAEDQKRTVYIFVNGVKTAWVKTDSNQFPEEPVASKPFDVKEGDVIRLGSANSNFIIKGISWNGE